MGHPVEIFTSPPPDSCICAICHDVLKDAVGINCGHSFCEECAKACLSSGSCPNCRADFTSYAPNYTTREWIGSMAVNCPHGQDEHKNESSKRARRNDDEAVSNDRCTWTGKCEDLHSHENTCEFKIITCCIDGCDHKCRRMDMTAHLSGDSFVLHMDMMKKAITAKYEGKIEFFEGKIQFFNRLMKNMKHELDERAQKILDYEGTIESMEGMMGIMRRQRNEQRDEIYDLKRKVVELEYKLQPRKYKQVMVNGCGIAAINGVYQRSGVVDDVPAYSKSSEYQGKRVAFKLFRCRDREQKRRWFISIVPGLNRPGTDKDIDFYFSDSHDENIPFPLNYKWSTIPERGVEPPPCIDLPSIYSRDRDNN